MKLLTLNLHLWAEDDQINKLKKIANFIKENDVDVCFFQEVAQLESNEIIVDNIKKENNAYLIKTYLDKEYFYAKILVGKLFFIPIYLKFYSIHADWDDTFWKYEKELKYDLKRKYGNSIEEILNYQLRKFLVSLINCQKSILK